MPSASSFAFVYYLLGLCVCVLYHFVGLCLRAHDKLGDPLLGKPDIVYLPAQLVIFLYKLRKRGLDLRHPSIDLVGVVILLLCDIKRYAVKNSIVTDIFHPPHFIHIYRANIAHFTQKIQCTFRGGAEDFFL